MSASNTFLITLNRCGLRRTNTRGAAALWTARLEGSASHSSHAGPRSLTKHTGRLRRRRGTRLSAVATAVKGPRSRRLACLRSSGRLRVLLLLLLRLLVSATVDRGGERLLSSRVASPIAARSRRFGATLRHLMTTTTTCGGDRRTHRVRLAATPKRCPVAAGVSGSAAS